MKKEDAPSPFPFVCNGCKGMCFSENRGFIDGLCRDCSKEVNRLLRAKRLDVIATKEYYKRMRANDTPGKDAPNE